MRNPLVALLRLKIKYSFCEISSRILNSILELHAKNCVKHSKSVLGRSSVTVEKVVQFPMQVLLRFLLSSFVPNRLLIYCYVCFRLCAFSVQVFYLQINGRRHAMAHYENISKHSANATIPYIYM
jgi:hypothetical protein